MTQKDCDQAVWKPDIIIVKQSNFGEERRYWVRNVDILENFAYVINGSSLTGL